jgi:hypothetical protein
LYPINVYNYDLPIKHNINNNFFKVRPLQEWWYIPKIPALKKQRQVVQGQPGLHLRLLKD